MRLYTTLWKINVRKKSNDNDEHLGKWKKTLHTNIAVNDPYNTRLC